MIQQLSSRKLSNRRLFASITLVGFALGAMPSLCLAAKKPRPMPTVEKVEEHTRRYLSGLEDYKPGDMLAQSQVEPLFAVLNQMGWNVSDQKKVLREISDDRDFLFQQFQSDRGRKFMRAIAKTPLAYDRLHRLCWTVGGGQAVKDIIRLPNGPEIVETLAGTSRGKDIGSRLSKAAKGADFNKPTGVIYSEDQLVERLKATYARDLAARNQAAQPVKN